MHERISDRLKQAINQVGLSYKEAAEKCGIPYRTLQNYLSGYREPTAIILYKISSQLGVSSDWLLSGEGPGVREKQALYSIQINDSIAEHNRAVFQNMCRQLETIINKGDFMMHSAVQTQLSAFAQQIEAKESKAPQANNHQKEDK